MPGLGHPTLAGGGVHHQEHLRHPVAVPAQHPDDLGQLFHQVVPGLEAAGRVDDHHVGAAGSPRLESVVGHRGRVAPGLTGNHLDSCPLGPDLELGVRGRTEGIGRADERCPPRSAQVGG